MKEHHVLKSLTELSPELLGTEPAAPKKTEPQQTQPLIQDAGQRTIRPSFLKTSDIRAYQGWGINE